MCVRNCVCYPPTSRNILILFTDYIMVMWFCLINLHFILELKLILSVILVSGIKKKWIIALRKYIFFSLPTKKGFKLRRKRGRLQNRLVCLDNGVWAPPRKFDYPYCEIIQCTRPKNILHGRLLPQVRKYYHSVEFHKNFLCIRFYVKSIL